MWFHSIVDSADSPPPGRRAKSKRRRPRRHPHVTRLRLEALEDRSLLSFNAAVDYNSGEGVAAVATGHFRNNSPLDDLVAVNAIDNTLSVLQNDGKGAFTLAHTYATGGAYPNSVAVGDLNGDGKLDVVVGERDSHDVSVLLGNGDGTFQPAIVFALPDVFPYQGSSPVPQAPHSIAVGDMNKDGRLDVIVEAEADTTIPPYTSLQTGYVDVLLGNGDGTLKPGSINQVASTTGNNAAIGNGFVAADFNRDGKLDVAVTSPGNSSVLLLPGNGDGTLGVPTSVATGLAYPNAVIAGDVNGDGTLDLVVSNQGSPNYTSGSVSVLIGNGTGGFGSAKTTPLPSITPAGYTGLTAPPLTQNPLSLVAGDLNHDGKLDLAVGTFSMYSTPSYYTYYRNNVNVLVGDGTGNFNDAQIVPLDVTLSPGATSMAAGNFNGDLYPDLAATNFGPISFLEPYYNVSVLINGANWPTAAPTAAARPSPAASSLASATTAGAPNTITAAADSADSSTNGGDTGSVQFSSSDGQAVLPGVYRFTDPDNGLPTIHWAVAAHEEPEIT